MEVGDVEYHKRQVEYLSKASLFKYNNEQAFGTKKSKRSASTLADHLKVDYKKPPPLGGMYPNLYSELNAS